MHLFIYMRLSTQSIIEYLLSPFCSVTFSKLHQSANSGKSVTNVLFVSKISLASDTESFNVIYVI